MDTNVIELNDVQTKVCSSCGRELPVSEFNKSSKSPDGLQYQCRECHRAAAKRCYEKHKAQKVIKTTDSPLSAFKPRELIQELINRGYKGKLTYTHVIEL